MNKNKPTRKSFFYRFYTTIEALLEHCYYVETKKTLSDHDLEILYFYLSGPLRNTIRKQPRNVRGKKVVEIGPHMHFDPPFSDKARDAFHSSGLTCVTKIVFSKRYFLDKNTNIKKWAVGRFDPMLETIYLKPLKNFGNRIKNIAPVREAKIIGIPEYQAREVLSSLGISDAHDIDHWCDYFRKIEKRNPTELEIFKITKGKTEHSEHPYLGSKIILDGKEWSQTLFEIIKEPWQKNKSASIIAFKDNASAIKGFKVANFQPSDPRSASPYFLNEKNMLVTFKAETHNFPTGVSPRPGAETGIGGRMRDNNSIGRGGYLSLGTSGISVAGLNIPGYRIFGEVQNLIYPESLAKAIDIVVDGSDGLTAYGNEHGEPLTNGFCHAFEMLLPSGERRAYLKPILFSGGLGYMFNEHSEKAREKEGMLIIQIGGPIYKIGFGGGLASSQIQSDSNQARDFNAVQRGNAEMANKTHRVVRDCIQSGRNPIMVIHDQGAAGICNVIGEIIGDAGGVIDIRKVALGDPTLSLVEIFGSESQERLALLIEPEDLELMQSFCDRERVNCEELGMITGQKRFQVFDGKYKNMIVDLSLENTKAPQKTIHAKTLPRIVRGFVISEKLTLAKSIEMVSSQFGVASKGWLMHKADRSVGGKVVLQQAVGPMQIPIANATVSRLSFFSVAGEAVATGAKPNVMLLNEEKGARMTVAEAILNLVISVVVDDVKNIALYMNEMYAAKLPGQDARLCNGVKSASNFIGALGMHINGGKDSLSLAAEVVNGKICEIVKAPDTLVVSAYAMTRNQLKVMTPDIKEPGMSNLLLIDIADGMRRLGGSALAQAHGELGSDCPDIDDVPRFRRALSLLQELIKQDLVLAMHDTIGDGFFQAMSEMCMASNCGANIKFPHATHAQFLAHHAEEAGVIIEYLPLQGLCIQKMLHDANIPYIELGFTTVKNTLAVYSGKEYIEIPVPQIRDWWEKTSFEIEKLQKNPACAKEEFESTHDRTVNPYYLKFEPVETDPKLLALEKKPKVAILREEGSNGEVEMAHLFYLAGFEVVDLAMTDLLSGRVKNLDDFVGLVKVGGFSYADVFGSGMGWAGSILFNTKLKKMFRDFQNRPDTFGLGVCNGFQADAVLGLYGDVRLGHNKSEKFESRLVRVLVPKSNALLLKGMEGSELSVWCAHGEGRIVATEETLDQLQQNAQVALYYGDDRGAITESYPWNPNGSPRGIAGICSKDGRFLGMMPHPERNVHIAHEPWRGGYPKDLTVGPWLTIAQNAYAWVINQK